MQRLHILVLCLVAGSFSALAQFPEDALRVSTPGFGVGARAIGLGNAYTGVANDFSAIYWNPAGLAQLKMGEFSAGLSHLNAGDESTFLGNGMTTSATGTAFNTIGIAHPVPVRRGSLVLAFGFQRQAMFTSGLEFSGRNPAGSIIQTWAPDGAPLTPEITVAELLELADTTAGGTFYSPINQRLTQGGNVTESGGLNNWSIAGAIDVAPNLSAGLTLSYVSGSYRYDRTYTEEDRQNFYATVPYDFNSLTVEDFISGDISGVSAKFGIMYRVPERLRLGIAVKTPTAYSIKEKYGTTYFSVFDDGSRFSVNEDGSEDGSVEYDVRTPWVISGGVSVVLRDLLLSADVEMTDWSTMEFTDANSDLIRENRTIASTFRSTLEYRFGLEYDIAGSGFRVRGGYGVKPSPYKDDPSDFDRTTVSVGVGLPLDANVMLDAGYARSTWKTFRTNYDGSPRVDEKIDWSTFLATLTFRF